MILPASDEIHDLDTIAFAHHAVAICVALEDDEIVFDRNAARVDVESGEKFGNRERAGQVVRLAIERDFHLIERTQRLGSAPTWRAPVAASAVRWRFERLFDWPMPGCYRERIPSVEMRGVLPI
jgi:hypothetical protein